MPGDTYTTTAAGQHGQQTSQRSVLLRSDQDSGMALVKSKDGRTKWLTVSADPSSTSFTWDERVRNWARNLGVCAQPSLYPPEQATPLPTPPPDELREQQQHWSTAVVDGSSSSSNDRPAGPDPSSPRTGQTIGTSSSRRTSTANATSTSKMRKPAGSAKRVGSFARGFLLGLGGGGGGGGSVAAAAAAAVSSSSSSSARDKNLDNPSTAAAAADSCVAAPAPGLLSGASERDTPAEARRGNRPQGDKGMAVPPVPPTASSAVVAAAASAVDTADAVDADAAAAGSSSGRERWVKGAPPSPTNSSSDSDSDSESDSQSRWTNGNTKSAMPPTAAGGGSGSNRGGGLGKKDAADVADAGENVVQAGSSGCSPDGDAGSGSGVVARKDRAASLDATTGNESMAWLETGGGCNKSGIGGGNGGGGGGGAKAASKKKKKSKAKSKASKAKKSNGANKAPASEPLLHSSPAEAEAAADAAAAAAAVAGKSPSESASAAAAKRQARSSKKRGGSLDVTFGSVNLLEFTRDVGGCGVPGDGTWGMALGLPFRETVVDVDGYEASKAEILEERTAELSKRQRHVSTGETRQFDHRPPGERNPLFSRIGEKERSMKLLEYACFHKGDLEEADRDSTHHGNASNPHKDEAAAAAAKPLGGKDTSDFDVFSHKVSHAEFVDKSQAANVELTALRNSRKDSPGCRCACVRTDKLNLAKLRGELNKRGLKASGSKKELAKVLQEVVRQEEEQDGREGHKVCRSEDCQCVRDGVECHADLCNCCKGPNMGHKDAHHGGNCGNPEGVYAYSSSVVRSYRGPHVSAKVVPGRERGHARSDSICSDHH